ncbi:unnamed protein product, partial [Vitis vinifera]|uniref:Uncharacterized protein n=1 Tax=Vitis vinifera TaxID=29760 RepID=D7T5N9_VITVI
MFPSKKFDRRLRINNDCISPIHDGRFPDNLLSPRSKLSMSLQFCREKGISPESLLPLSIKNISEFRVPIELGISPDKLLCAISTSQKFYVWTPQNNDKMLFVSQLRSCVEV